MNTDLSRPPSHARSSTAKLLFAGAILLVLAAGSFELSYVHLGHYALLVALLIASVKAAIVLAVFMDIGRERASVRASAVAAVAMLILFAGFVAADVLTREGPDVRPAGYGEP